MDYGRVLYNMNVSENGTYDYGTGNEANGTYDYYGTGNETNGTYDYGAVNGSCYFNVASQITSFFIGNKFISRIHSNPVDRNWFSSIRKNMCSIILYPAFYEYKNVQK